MHFSPSTLGLLNTSWCHGYSNSHHPWQWHGMSMIISVWKRKPLMSGSRTSVRDSQAPKRREEDVIPGWSSKDTMLCLPHSSAVVDTAPPTLAIQGLPSLAFITFVSASWSLKTNYNACFSSARLPLQTFSYHTCFRVVTPPENNASPDTPHKCWLLARLTFQHGSSDLAAVYHPSYSGTHCHTRAF